MQQKKKEIPNVKPKLHPRNKNRERYDFKKLINCYPKLEQFVKLNLYNDESIDFANHDAVKVLNKAILKYHYGIESWDIPEGYLCPPIPGRADYIHHIADLLCRCNFGKIPTGDKIKCMDVGVGANCIYPIIGVNTFLSAKGSPTVLPMEVIRSTTEEKEFQIEMLNELKKGNEEKGKEALHILQQAAIHNKNIFNELMETVKYCSLGQITNALFEVGGQYRRSM